MAIRNRTSYESNLLGEILFQTSYVRYNRTEQQTGHSDSQCIAMPADVYGRTHCVDETNNFSIEDNPQVMLHGHIDITPTM